MLLNQVLVVISTLIVLATGICLAAGFIGGFNEQSDGHYSSNILRNINTPASNQANGFVTTSEDSDEDQDVDLDALEWYCGQSKSSKLIKSMSNAYECSPAERGAEQPSNRLLGAHQTDSLEFPFYVILRVEAETRDEERTAVSWTCGGTIIHENLILTATHCFVRDRALVRSVSVMAGPTSSNPIYVPGISYCTMKEFRTSEHEGPVMDVSLLKLQSSFNYSDHIQPACIDLYRAPKLDVACVTVGTGKRNKDHFEYNQVKDLSALLVSQSCSRDLRNVWDQVGRTCYQSAEGKEGTLVGSPCKGDGGSPIYCINRCYSEEEAQVYAASQISFVVSHNPNDTGCDTDRNNSLPLYAMDYMKLREEFSDMIQNCLSDKEKSKPSPWRTIRA